MLKVGFVRRESLYSKFLYRALTSAPVSTLEENPAGISSKTSKDSRKRKTSLNNLTSASTIIPTKVSATLNCTSVVMHTLSKSTVPSTFKLTSLNSAGSAKIGSEILKSGGIIATPTDTVYGLAADAQNIKAVQKLYEIKGRNPEKPIAICLSQISQLSKWANITVTNELLNDFLPGPVTLVFERLPTLNPELNPETYLIGIRIPNHQFIRQLAEEHGGPIALTSANRSSEPSTLSPSEFSTLWPYLDCIFDGGHLLNSQHPVPQSLIEETQSQHSTNNNSSHVDEKTLRAGSTVINLSQAGCYSIIREGSAFQSCVQILRDKYQLVEKKDL